MQVTMETWRMREQWTPGALFSPPRSAGNQAMIKLDWAVITSKLGSVKN